MVAVGTRVYGGRILGRNSVSLCLPVYCVSSMTRFLLSYFVVGFGPLGWWW